MTLMDGPRSDRARELKPRLSVVVPAYNIGKYLRECLDSIAAQRLQDLEVVIVDDCSLDDSEAIALEYQARDSRMRCVSHRENLGLGAARNTGIRHATGDWITFVDGDDFVEKGLYESALAMIDRYAADGAVVPVLKFDDVTGTEDAKSFPFNTPFPNPTRFDATNPYYRTIGPTVCNKIFRRSDLTDHQIRFPEGLKHEDEEFTFKYVAKVEPLLVFDGSHFYHYRQREGSIMRSARSSRLDLSKILVNLFEFLVAAQLLDRYRAHLIFKAREYLGYFAGTDVDETPLPSFISDLKSVVDRLDLSREELDESPPYFLAIFVENPNAQMSLLRRESRNVASIESNGWYRFGRLSPRRKLAFLLRQSIIAARRALRR